MDLQKDSDFQDELAQLKNEVERLKAEKLLQGDEIRALKAEIRSYQDEMTSMSSKVQSLERQALQETPALTIGKEVRLRYMEQHRQRMGKKIGNLGYDRIKRGDRAAHRGRPVPDALLCLAGDMTDHGVFSDLYGVSPEIMEKCKDIREIVEITGFRGSLKSQGWLTRDFEVLFERAIKLAKTHVSLTDLRSGFEGNKVLQQLQNQIQDCYDKIVAERRREQQSLGSRLKA